jgi:hypothetical protein
MFFSGLPQNISLLWSWVSRLLSSGYKHSAPSELSSFIGCG